MIRNTLLIKLWSTLTDWVVTGREQTTQQPQLPQDLQFVWDLLADVRKEY